MAQVKEHQRKQSKALLANKSINREVNMNTESIPTKYPLLGKSHIENQGDGLNNEYLEDYPLLQKARIKAHSRKMKSGKIVQVREHQDTRKDKSRATSLGKVRQKKSIMKIAITTQQGFDSLRDRVENIKDKYQVFIEDIMDFNDKMITEDEFYYPISHKSIFIDELETIIESMKFNVTLSALREWKEKAKFEFSSFVEYHLPIMESMKLYLHKIPTKYPLLGKALYSNMDKINEFQIGDDKMKTPQKPMLDSVKFPTLAKAHANLKKSMSFKIGGQKLKTAIDGKIAICKGELIVLEKEYPQVPIYENGMVAVAESTNVDINANAEKPIDKKITGHNDHWKVRTKKRDIKELETYSRNVDVKITYNLDKYELSQFGL